MTHDDEIDAVIAVTIRDAEGCGTTLNGRRVFCNDPADSKMDRCFCKDRALSIRKALTRSGYRICSTSDTREAGLRRAAEIAKSTAAEEMLVHGGWNRASENISAAILVEIGEKK